MSANPIAPEDFFREAYEQSKARADRLEADNDRLYRQAAQHTVESGMKSEEIRKLKEQIEVLSHTPRPWISVAERKPADGELVLIYARDAMDHVHVHRWPPYYDHWGVTHWAPLPADPAAFSKEGTAPHGKASLSDGVNTASLCEDCGYRLGVHTMPEGYCPTVNRMEMLVGFGPGKFRT